TLDYEGLRLGGMPTCKDEEPLATVVESNPPARRIEAGVLGLPLSEADWFKGEVELLGILQKHQTTRELMTLNFPFRSPLQLWHRIQAFEETRNLLDTLIRLKLRQRATFCLNTRVYRLRLPNRFIGRLNDFGLPVASKYWFKGELDAYNILVRRRVDLTCLYLYFPLRDDVGLNTLLLDRPRLIPKLSEAGWMPRQYWMATTASASPEALLEPYYPLQPVLEYGEFSSSFKVVAERVDAAAKARIVVGNANARQKRQMVFGLPYKTGVFSEGENALYYALIKLDFLILEMLGVSGTRSEVQIGGKLRQLRSKFFHGENYREGPWTTDETLALMGELEKLKHVEPRHLVSLAFTRQLSRTIKSRSPFQCSNKIKYIYRLNKVKATIKLPRWSPHKVRQLEAAVAEFGVTNFRKVSSKVPETGAECCKRRWIPNRYQGFGNRLLTEFDEDEKTILARVLDLNLRLPPNLFLPGRSFELTRRAADKLFNEPEIFKKLGRRNVINLADFYIYDGCNWPYFLSFAPNLTLRECYLVLSHLAARHFPKYMDLESHRAIRSRLKRDSVTRRELNLDKPPLA
ncbi:hypothetical protein L0F63_001923, partial [Massospora cicadina]